MRTTPLAGLCLVSAMVAMAQLPHRPSSLMPWPVALPAVAHTDTVPPLISPTAVDVDQAGDGAAAAFAASVASEAVVVLRPALDADFNRPTGLAVRLDTAPDTMADSPAASLQTIEMRSMPSGGTAIVPRRPGWAAPTRAPACPWSTAQACAAWHAGR